jgi:hypothetical protein
MIEAKDIIQNTIVSPDGWGDDDTLETFHPSKAGSCKRQIILSKLKARDFSDGVKGEMAIGTAIHNYIQNMKKIREYYDVEVKFKKQTTGKWYWQGSVDLMCKDKTELIDIKSVKTLQYLQTKPYNTHSNQVLAYMVCNNIKLGKIIYVDKVTFEMIEHKVLPREDVWDAIQKKNDHVYQELLKLWASDTLYMPFQKCQCFQCKKEVVKPKFMKVVESTGEEHKRLWKEYKDSLRY